MNIFSFFFLLFFCILFSLSLAAKPSKKFDSSKIVNNFVPIVDSNFTQVIFNERNDFSSVLFLSTKDPKHACNLCRMVESNLIGIIDLYYNQYSNQNNVNDNKIFFFSAEVSQNRNAFMALELSSVPRVYIVPKFTKVSFETLKNYEVSASVVTGAFQGLLDDVSNGANVKVIILH